MNPFYKLSDNGNSFHDRLLGLPLRKPLNRRIMLLQK
jgi:hypothetical protein